MKRWAAADLIAWSVAHDIDVYLICATRGERGWAGRAEDNPGLAALGKIREAELREAAQVLGIHEVILLDYIDGDLDRADPAEAIGQIAYHVRRLQPQVVVTFDCFGAYGHPDHIAISQFTHAALVCAADRPTAIPAINCRTASPSCTGRSMRRTFVDQLKPIFGGTISMPVDGETREWTPFPEWSITTRLDATAHWQTVRRAVQCHRSQLPTLPDMDQLSDEQHQTLLGAAHPLSGVQLRQRRAQRGTRSVRRAALRHHATARIILHSGVTMFKRILLLSLMAAIALTACQTQRGSAKDMLPDVPNTTVVEGQTITQFLAKVADGAALAAANPRIDSAHSARGSVVDVLSRSGRRGAAHLHRQDLPAVRGHRRHHRSQCPDRSGELCELRAGPRPGRRASAMADASSRAPRRTR